jgi:hypothetical protein
MGLLTALLLASASPAVSAQDTRVEVPFKMAENAMIIDATINNRTLSFMFDTGFGGAFVVDHNINLGKATGKMMLRDFVGQFAADTVKLTSVKLGSKVIDASEMEAVMQPADYTFSYNTHTDGIMGFQVIKDYVTEINFQNHKMIFHPKSMDITQRKPDNERTFLARMLPIGGNSIEMEVIASTGKRMILALDTGNAFYATTHKDVLERVGLWEGGRKPQFMKTSMVASGPVDSFYKRMTDVTIYGVKVPASYWSIIDLPSSSAEGDGTIGFGFLKNFNIIIDYGRRRVWLENFTGEIGNQPVGNPGIAAAYDARIKRVRVFRVTPASPAEKAGVRAGDHILAINDRDLAGEIGYREVEALIEGEVGSTVKLVLSRGGNIIRLELERAKLVNE